MKNTTPLPLWPTDEDLDELDELFDNFLDLEPTDTTLTWKEAYEANKTRTKCILCGNETKKTPLFSSTIRTCDCVDKLARKEKNGK